MIFVDSGSCFDAIELGHSDVDDDHVRRKFLRQGDCFHATCSLTDDFEIGISRKHGTKPLPDYAVIVRNQNANRAAHADTCVTGSSAVIRVPPFGFESMLRVPPSSATRS